MRQYDLHDNLDVKTAIVPVVATDNTAMVSAILYRAGCSGVELIIATGTLADADATFTLLFEDGDTANLSDNAEVASGYLLGTEALASFTFASDNKVFKIGYVGLKRYCRATITPANNTGNAPISAVWVTKPTVAPTANPPA